MSSQALNKRLNAVKSRIPLIVEPEEEAALLEDLFTRYLPPETDG